MNFTIVPIRGMYEARCAHCTYTTKRRFFPGHTQAAIRAHLRDVHGIAARWDR